MNFRLGTTVIELKHRPGRLPCLRPASVQQVVELARDVVPQDRRAGSLHARRRCRRRPGRRRDVDVFVQLAPIFSVSEVHRALVEEDARGHSSLHRQLDSVKPGLGALV